MSRQVVVPVPVDAPVWTRVFTVAPLVLVGTVDAAGVPDLAPKHMVMPLGWGGRFCFVCTPRHVTYRNAVAQGAFTVSFPTADQVLDAGLAATEREPDSTKPALTAIATVPATAVEGVLVAGAHLFLECELERTIDFDDASLVVGNIVHAAADERALRSVERDDADVVHELPLLAYVSPGRFATVDASHAFPYPADFRL